VGEGRDRSAERETLWFRAEARYARKTAISPALGSDGPNFSVKQEPFTIRGSFGVDK